jgi:hypothetical protein
LLRRKIMQLIEIKFPEGFLRGDQVAYFQATVNIPMWTALSSSRKHGESFALHARCQPLAELSVAHPVRAAYGGFPVFIARPWPTGNACSGSRAVGDRSMADRLKGADLS